MLVATEMPRTFKCNVKNQTIELADPDPNMSPEAVMNFYANTYPELITAKVEGPTFDNDKVNYKFSSVMGTKG